MICAAIAYPPPENQANENIIFPDDGGIINPFASTLLTSALIIYASAPVWAVMVVTGTILGLGIGLIDAGINTYIVNDSHHSHFIGILHGFYGTGALLGPAIATTLS